MLLPAATYFPRSDNKILGSGYLQNCFILFYRYLRQTEVVEKSVKMDWRQNDISAFDGQRHPRLVTKEVTKTRNSQRCPSAHSLMMSVFPAHDG